MYACVSAFMYVTFCQQTCPLDQLCVDYSNLSHFLALFFRSLYSPNSQWDGEATARRARGCKKNVSRKRPKDITTGSRDSCPKKYVITSELLAIHVWYVNWWARTALCNWCIIRRLTYCSLRIRNMISDNVPVWSSKHVHAQWMHLYAVGQFAVKFNILSPHS